MLREHLNDSSSFVSGFGIDLEISSRHVEYGVEFVAGELVGGEDSERLRVSFDRILEVVAESLHRTAANCQRAKFEERKERREEKDDERRETKREEDDSRNLASLLVSEFLPVSENERFVIRIRLLRHSRSQIDVSRKTVGNERADDRLTFRNIEIEEFRRFVRQEPLLEELEFFRVGSSGGERDLMRSPAVEELLSGRRRDGSGHSFRSAEDEERESRLVERLSRSCGGLNSSDLRVSPAKTTENKLTARKSRNVDGPVHRCSKVEMNRTISRIVPTHRRSAVGDVVDESNLISCSRNSHQSRPR